MRALETLEPLQCQAMQIKDIARATGIDTETIRFYEKQGLLGAPPRRDNGYRDYGPAHVERLSFIRHCRALDMPLTDIARLLALADSPPDDCSDVNRLVDAQIGRVRARLHSMRALEKQLLQLRRQCRQPQSGQGCGILGELVAAAQAEACVCHPTALP